MIYGTPIVADAFTATFEFQIGGGVPRGGDGLVFMLETDGPTAVGSQGGGLGAAGLHGFGFELDTALNSACGDAPANHVGIDSLAACDGGTTQGLLLASLVTSNAVPIQLRNSGWHSCTVVVTAGAASMSIDGTAVIPAFTVPGLSSATPYHFGFGAATGGATDRHEIRNVLITFPTARCL